jgi:VIT1/CCC1 family predicted Fe2+/Mn2+ transporter
VHDREEEEEEEEDNDNGRGATNYSKAVIFGCNDGLNLSIVVVSAAVACDIEWQNVVALSLSATLAGAVILGTGEFFSARAHKAYMQTAVWRETWNFKQNRGNAVESLSLRYQRKGISKADADLVAVKMATNEKLFIEQTVMEELGLQLPDDTDSAVLVEALVMTLSCMLGGCTPIAAFGLLSASSSSLDGDGDENDGFPIDSAYTGYMAVAALLLFLCGAMKCLFSRAHWALTASEAIGQGGLGAAVAFTASSKLATFIRAAANASSAA